MVVDANKIGYQSFPVKQVDLKAYAFLVELTLIPLQLPTFGPELIVAIQYNPFKSRCSLACTKIQHVFNPYWIEKTNLKTKQTQETKMIIDWV